MNPKELEEYLCSSPSIWHGLHDDIWVRHARKKHPDSLVFKAWDDAEHLTQEELFTAMKIIGAAEIALRWAYANPEELEAIMKSWGRAK